MKLATVLLALSAGYAVSASAQDVTDKMVGTWKLRTDKFVPSDDIIASGTVVVTKTAPDTTRSVSYEVLKNGNKREQQVFQICNGQERPIPNGPAGMTAICNARTGDFTIKRDGKVIMDVKREFSRDGRIVTFRRHRLDSAGKWVDDVRVWEKQ
jgi:hypothetical protein